MKMKQRPMTIVDLSFWAWIVMVLTVTSCLLNWEESVLAVGQLIDMMTRADVVMRQTLTTEWTYQVLSRAYWFCTGYMLGLELMALGWVACQLWRLFVARVKRELRSSRGSRVILPYTP